MPNWTAPGAVWPGMLRDCWQREQRTISSAVGGETSGGRGTSLGWDGIWRVGELMVIVYEECIRGKGKEEPAAQLRMI